MIKGIGYVAAGKLREGSLAEAGRHKKTGARNSGPRPVLVKCLYYLDPASARTHSAQALESYSEMKLFGNHNKDYAQSCHSLYESRACTAQARSLTGSRY